MSPQRSNRGALLEGALGCLRTSPPADITSREIAAAAGANAASITYHFASKDHLLSEAMLLGFDRWLGELSSAVGDLSELRPGERLARVAESVTPTMRAHRGLVHAFLSALASAPHDGELRSALADSYRRSRATVAHMMGWGEDRTGHLLAAIAIATFDGLLVQLVVDDELDISDVGLRDALRRLSGS